MAAGVGYSKIATDGLVFAYDINDARNSFKGKPAYNVLGTPYPWVGNNNANYDPGYFFYTSVGSETVNIPALGTYNNVQYVTINNGYTGYGTGGNYNCCPSLFRYGDWGVSTGVSGNTLYTYSIIYKCQSGYYNSNYMYHYEYGPSGYLTEFGVFDGSKRTDLGDGWYWAYNTFTTQAACTTIYPGMWYYQYNTPDKVWVLGAMLVQGDYKIPPLNFLSGYETRSDTQGLLDLTSTNNIATLNNSPFDSNAQLYFDGTNDYINIPHNSAIAPSTGYISVEAVFKASSAGSNNGSIIYNKENEYEMSAGGGYISYAFRPNWAWVGHTSFNTNQWYHTMLTYDQSYQRLYVNGVEVYSAALSGAIGNAYSEALRIGARGGNGAAYDFFNGYIPVVKIYNRALTAGEVLQNYNHYKTRFNLP